MKMLAALLLLLLLVVAMYVCMYVAYVLYSECHNSPSLAAVCSSNNLHMHSE